MRILVEVRTRIIHPLVVCVYAGKVHDLQFIDH